MSGTTKSGRKAGSCQPNMTQVVANDLLSEIERGAIRAGEHLPSHADLAKKFAVSPATVSAAMRLLAEQVSVKWIPGRGMLLEEKCSAPAKVFMVGIIGWRSGYLDSPLLKRERYIRPIVNSLLHTAHENRDALLWIPDTDAEPLDMDRIQGHRTDCVISMGIPLQAETVLEFRRRRIPLVLANRHLEHMGVSYVDEDDTSRFRELVRVFRENGHRRVAAIVVKAGWPEADERRFREFCNALLLRGCVYDYVQYWREFPCRDVFDLMEHSEEVGQREMARLLDLPDPPTAVYCFNDLMARGAVQAIASRGLRVGKDVSIIITGCAEDAGPFSLFATPHEELAAKLLRTAHEISRDPHRVCQIDVPEPYVDRGSVACLSE